MQEGHSVATTVAPVSLMNPVFLSMIAAEVSGWSTP